MHGKENYHSSFIFQFFDCFSFLFIIYQTNILLCQTKKKKEDSIDPLIFLMRTRKEREREYLSFFRSRVLRSMINKDKSISYNNISFVLSEETHVILSS